MQNGMDVNRFELPCDKTIFITGSSKNAGKTTFLNYILPRIRPAGDFAFLTIGIDGERKDQIFGTDKPVIRTCEGDILLTSESLANASDASFSILQVFPWKTVLGKLVLVKTEREGLIEIAGPENNIQLGKIIGFIEKNMSIKTILIDGAINRITQISASKSSFFYYVTRINNENLRSSIEKLKVISLLNRIRIFNKDTEYNHVYIHRGAFTKNSIKKIGESTEILVIEDFTKIFLDYTELKKLIGGYRIFFLSIMLLQAFVVNLYDIDERDFKKEIEKSGITDNIIFNPYIKKEGLFE